MKAVIICPDESSEAKSLAESCPLVNLPLLGKSVIEHWIEHLAASAKKFKEITILATDRPEEVRALVGDGERWGLAIEVIPEKCELTREEAWSKYGTRTAHKLVDSPAEIFLADHLPDSPEKKLFTSFADFFVDAEAALKNVTERERVGAHEIQPGVWMGLHSHLSPGVTLHPPCWIGEHVRISKNAIIGPDAIIEDKVVIGPGAKVTNSYVGSETLVGAATRLKDSLAIGNTLMNWRNGSVAKVADPFLMCALQRHHRDSALLKFAGRLAALAALGLSAPLISAFVLHAFAHGRRILRPLQAVLPTGESGGPPRLLTYYELTSARGLWRRWPQLWNVARGQFTWVGNRPLHPMQVAKLASDFERLWLAAPLGLFSHADAQGCAHSFSDEAKAHASFYAAQSSWRLDWNIFIWAWWRALTRVPQSERGKLLDADAAILKEKSLALARGG